MCVQSTVLKLDSWNQFSNVLRRSGYVFQTLGNYQWSTTQKKKHTHNLNFFTQSTFFTLEFRNLVLLIFDLENVDLIVQILTFPT